MKESVCTDNIINMDDKQSTRTIADPKKVLGVITNIQVYSLHDGPGVRTIVFTKGCPLRCRWCCNPECIKGDIEIEFYNSKCIKCGACLEVCRQEAINKDLDIKDGFKINKELCNECGECIEVCPKGAIRSVGKIMSVDEIMQKIKKDRYFYIISKGGLTISGGEPLYQFKFAHELLRQSYNENIDNTLETCGFARWECYEKISPYINLVFYDIKHMDAAVHKQWTGVSNEIIFNNLEKLSKTGVKIIIRIPLIPDFNTDKSNIEKTASFISSLNNIEKVELMPFHQLGKDKYFRLCQDYELKNSKSLSTDARGREKIKSIKDIFKSYSINVEVG